MLWAQSLINQWRNFLRNFWSNVFWCLWPVCQLLAIYNFFSRVNRVKSGIFGDVLVDPKIHLLHVMRPILLSLSKVCPFDVYKMFMLLGLVDRAWTRYHDNNIQRIWPCLTKKSFDVYRSTWCLNLCSRRNRKRETKFEDAIEPAKWGN